MNDNDLLNILDGTTAAPTREELPPVEAPDPTPAAETPAVEPEITNPDTPPVNEPPAINPDEELVKITGGTIKSTAELNELLQKANTLTDLESRVKQYEAENTDLKSKVAVDPFASDYHRKLNQLAKDGATPDQLNAFSKVNSVGDIDKLDAVEAKVLTLQLKDGLTEQEARNYINRTFKMNPDVYTEEEIEEGKIDLKISSRADKEYLKTHKTEVETSPLQQQQAQQQAQQRQYEQHIQKVEPIAKAVLAEAKDFFKGQSINGKTGESAITVDFTPSEASLQTLGASVDAYVKQLGENLPATQEGRDQIAGFAKSVLAIANYQNWIVEAASQREKQVRAEYHNPTPINRGTDHPNPGKASQDELNQKLLELYS
jgi:hypothetical protein